ncbi:rho GTPase-activating protein 29-like [Engraulis encrasicolus]|uniref:rho GTPase-activating protein 29-like n=1 Tax=Engraulis encrasicolus TaxID=184585 RepID=UPI002FD070A2
MLEPHSAGSVAPPRPWSSEAGRPGSADDGPGGTITGTSGGTTGTITGSSSRGEPEYIMRLVEDLRRFADVLLSLKDAFLTDEEPVCVQRVVQDRLTELLRILRAVIAKHPTLNSTHVLSATGNLIAKVKGVNFKEVNSENKEAIFGDIHTSIDSLAFTFGNVVSDFLMGDVDSTSTLGLSRSRSLSFDNLTSAAGEYSRATDDATVCDVDVGQLRNGRGVESALLYAKAWSKYTKELLGWLDKRINLDIECAKSMAKMAESAKGLFSQQDFMPFREIYISAFKKDVEYSQLLLQTANALQTNRFIQPLLARRAELDKLRKELKEQWQREQKKMHEAEACVKKAYQQQVIQSTLTLRSLHEAEACVKKAYQQQVQRREEYEKERARSAPSGRAEEEQGSGARQRDKRKRIEEEALLRTEEAVEQYRVCVSEAEGRRASLVATQTNILTQIREMLTQADLTLKAVTVNLFQLQRVPSSCLPPALHSLSERARRYTPGHNYTHFLSSLPRHQHTHTHLKTRSYDLTSAGSRDDVRDEVSSRRRASGGDDYTRGGGASGGGGGASDSESAGGSSETQSLDSPVASPVTMGRGLPRTPSTGTMSSADDLDRDPDNSLGDGLGECVSSSGPFQSVVMSRAAQSHRLRRLRAPTKCRECDGLVVFHGAECEECSLACHKKCLEALSITCGHRKLQGRLALFGEDFLSVARGSPDGVPFIIRKCAAEVESRAITLKGIYRVNGAKSRVEKLCQAFENGKELVELSDHSPHDISNVLKLYLRQLPEPLIQHRFYNDMISIAKETQKIVMVEAASVLSVSSLVTCVLCSVLPGDLSLLSPSRLSVEGHRSSSSNRSPILLRPSISAPQPVSVPTRPISVPWSMPVPTTTTTTRSNSEPTNTSVVSIPVPQSPPARDPPAAAAPPHAATPPLSKPPDHRQPRPSSVPASPCAADVTTVAASSAAATVAASSSAAAGGCQREPNPPDRSSAAGTAGGAVPVRTTTGSDVPDSSGPRAVQESTVSSIAAAAAAASTVPAAASSAPSSASPPPQAAPSSAPPPPQASTVLDTQALRRTWEREYRPPPLLTPRTAMILANLPRPVAVDTTSPPPIGPIPFSTTTSTTNTTTTTNTTPTPANTSHVTTTTTLSSSTSSVSTMFPRSPYCVSVGSGGGPHVEDRGGPPVGGIGGPPVVAFRAPRTLHPPPGTFYQPQSTSPSHQSRIPNPTNPAPAEADPAVAPGDGTGVVTSSSSPPSATGTATRQRLRSSLQELEPREAHFV